MTPESFIPDPIFKALTSIARSAVPPVINQAQRNEIVARTLTALKLDPVQPPKDFDNVYVYALVEYGVAKPDAILKLFREKDIKKAFLDTYNCNCPLGFFKKAERLLNSSDRLQDLRDKIQKTEHNPPEIELRTELEEFGQVFIDVAKRTKTKDFEPYPDWELDPYPKTFKPLIEEKIRAFCGREFIFTGFEEFLKQNARGYFTVVGEAGMGKSAIAAQYVAHSEQFPPCYFNVRATGQNKPELFLDSIRKQLIKRYPLQNAEKDDLTTLLQKVSDELASDERLVIVVDALDEVEQESREHNLLYLPKDLPNRVYFLLTRRPYTQTRLLVSPDVPMKTLDLTDERYVTLNREDVEKYIRFFLDTDPNHKDALRQWIQERNITADEFVQQVADKSENNFMYLRYVLPAIASGYYKTIDLKNLPEGLIPYYQDHWRRMGMEDKSQEGKLIILFILVEIGRAIPCEMIAAIAQQDELEVAEVLEEWVEYLKQQEVKERTWYTIYHASFLEFLKGKRELKSTRKLFQEVNQRIADFLREYSKRKQRKAGNG